MIENRDDAAADKREPNGIGTGKKVGLYGCAFLILAVIVVAVILILTGYYAPFQGTEGVGP